MLCGKDILWTMFCGPFDIALKDLTPLTNQCPQHDILYKDIKENGLLNTLDVRWIVGEDKLTILRGNQRYSVLKELGYEKVPCHITTIVPKTQEATGIVLQKFLVDKCVTGESPRLARTPKEWKCQN